MGNKGGSFRNRFIFTVIAIFIFIFSLITSLTIGNNISEQNNLSNSTIEVNLTVDSSLDNYTLVSQTENLSNSLVNISNISSNQEILTNVINNNIKTDEKILETPSLNSIVDARTEINRLEDGAFNGIFYPEDTFKFYSNQWYDLISLADISASNNKLNISYENNYLSLNPYIVYNGNKIKLTNLDSALFNQINPEARILKARNYFKFAINFSNIGNISELGFDYESNVPITSFDNKTSVNGILVIDYSDLINEGYTIFVNDSLIQITNIKNGFNDLDPIVKFNSSAGTKDGAIEGGIGGTGDGTNVFTGGTYQKAGYLVGVDTDLEDRFFLNFNTSSLGKDVQITDVLLWVSVRSKIATCGYPAFTFDVYTGSFIGDSLDITDYSKGSWADSVTMQNVDNYTISLSNGMVNVTGDTDIAFKPSWIHTDVCNEYLTIYKGNAAAMVRPYLNVTYNQKIYNLTYDLNGNLIQGFGKYFEYDGFNRLVRVRNSTNDIVAQYWYDQDGNRIKKVEVSNTGNQTTYYIGNFIQVRNISGVFNTTYYYDRDSLVGEKRYDGKTYFYHPDHLGSTQLVTNSTGGVVENTSYNPYGEVIQDGKSRYQFTGKELDRETNFEYYGARYYYPYLTRFIQPDINIPDFYNPQYLNRYMYVLGNPYKYVDKDGKEALPCPQCFSTPFLFVPQVAGVIAAGYTALIIYEPVVEIGYQIRQAYPPSQAARDIYEYAYVQASGGPLGQEIISNIQKNLEETQKIKDLTDPLRNDLRTKDEDKSKEVDNPLDINLHPVPGLFPSYEFLVRQITNAYKNRDTRSSSSSGSSSGNGYWVTNPDSSQIWRQNEGGGHRDCKNQNCKGG